MNKEIKENKEINKRNIEKFKIFGCYEDYVCCLCGIKVYTDDSYSNRGDRLICHECYYNKFVNSKEARKWIDRGE